MSDLHYIADLSVAGFNRGVEEIKRGLDKAEGAVSDSTKRMNSSLSSLLGKAKGALAGLGVTLGVKELVGKVASVRGEFQQLEIAFTTLLGSEREAQSLMSQLTETAARTPFDLQSVTQGAKLLLAYGTEAGEVNETLTRLGDIASGLSVPLGDLVYLYGTTMTQGRMFTQDLRQFMGRGVPLAEELARQFGVTEDAVADLVGSGKVGAEEFKAAIWSLTDEGSKFGGLMAAQSASINGQWSNLGDSVQQAMNEIGKAAEPLFDAVLSGASVALENWESLGRALLEAAGALGTYRAALVAITAVQKASAVAAAAHARGLASVNAATVLSRKGVRALRTAVSALNKAMLANPYVAAAAAITALGVAIYKLATYQTDAERQQARLDEALSEGEKAALAERVALAGLWQELESGTAGTASYEAAKAKVISQYSKYGVTLNDETLAVGSLASTYDELTRAITRSSEAQAKSDFLSSERSSYEDTLTGRLSDIQGQMLKAVNKGRITVEEYAGAYAEVSAKAMAGKIGEAFSGYDTFRKAFSEGTVDVILKMSRGVSDLREIARAYDLYMKAVDAVDTIGPLPKSAGGAGSPATPNGGADSPATPKGGAGKEAARGSYDWLEGKIKEWNARLSAAADEAGRTEAQGYIDAYTEELAALKAAHLKAQDDPSGWLAPLSEGNGLEAWAGEANAAVGGMAAAETAADRARRAAEEADEAHAAAYSLIFASVDELTETQLQRAIEATREEIERAKSSGDVEALTELYSRLNAQLEEMSTRGTWGFGSVAAGFRKLASARRLQATAADTTRTEAERSKADEDAAEAQKEASELIASGIRQVSDTLSGLGSAMESFGGTIGEVGGLLSGLASNTENIKTAWTSGDKGSVIAAGIQSAVSLATMVGEQIQANKEYQEEWNRTVEQCAHEYAMLQLEALDYEQANIFGVENPYAELTAASEKYRASMKTLSEYQSKLAGGQVQTGTKKVASGANVGTGVAAGAGVGAAVGSVVPAIGTAIGAAAGAIIGGITGLFAGKKKVAVYESLQSQYGWLYDDETYELNPEILADYEKLDEETKQVVDNWEEIRDTALEAEEEMEESLSALAGNLGDELSEALSEAFRNGDVTSAIDDFGDTVTGTLEDIIEQLVFAQYFQGLFDELEERMKSSFDEGGDGSITDDIQWLAENYGTQLAGYEEAMRQAKEELAAAGYDAWSSDTRTSSAKGVAQASQDTVDELNGRFTVIQGHTYSISEDTRTLAAGSAVMLQRLAGIEQYASQLRRLEAVEASLSGLASDAATMRTALADIRDKGVKMR